MAFGPNHDSPALCLSCLSPVTGEFSCPDCGLPLCDEKCGQGEHRRWECRIFRDRRTVVNITDFSGAHCPFYQSITPLRSDNTIPSHYQTVTSLMSPRCLMLKRDDPVKWNSLKVRPHPSPSPALGTQVSLCHPPTHLAPYLVSIHIQYPRQLKLGI